MSDNKDKNPEVKDLSPKKDAKGGRGSAAQGAGQAQGVQLGGANLNSGANAQKVSAASKVSEN